MLITVFLARLRPGVRDDYSAAVDRMNELARTMLGYISHKTFYAEDGERCTIVEVENEEGVADLADESGTPRSAENGTAEILQ